MVIEADKKKCVFYKKGFCAVSRQLRKCEFDLNDKTCKGYQEKKELIKGFVTYKCGRCNNVMRNEYWNGIDFQPCKVCLEKNWIEIKMDEVEK